MRVRRKPRITDRAIEYHDAGPDSLGRRRFTLFWTDTGGIFRPQPHPEDGEPVGYRRAQCFFADPNEYPKFRKER
ncbi:MAG TPA: hypothetical protein ENK57_20465 [Polyangiaceae bacterium]|nr:hypothetical protein [Polyangiaceae bacterium]